MFDWNLEVGPSPVDVRAEWSWCQPLHGPARVYSMLGDLDLGLIVYRTEKDKFYRIDIQMVIAVFIRIPWTLLRKRSSLGSSKESKFGSNYRGYAKRARLFLRRNRLPGKAIPVTRTALSD
jgi:hypothetical protein